MLLQNDGTVVLDNSFVMPNGSLQLGGEDLQDRAVGIRYQPGLDRPYKEDRPNHPLRGQQAVRIQAGMKYNNAKGRYEPRMVEVATKTLRRRGIEGAVWNTNSLPRMAWVHLIREMVEVHRERLTVWPAIASRSMEPGVDPYRSATIEFDAISDPGEVIEDMDVISDGRNDSPVSKTRSAPIPIIYGNWHVSDRRLRINENNGRPFTTIMNRAITRRIAERVEDNTLGLTTQLTFGTLTGNYANAHDGTSTNYGLATHTARLTKTNFTAPTAGGWTPETTYNELLAALTTMRTNKFYGPYIITFSTDWWQYLSRVFSVSGGNNNGQTLLSMIQQIPGVVEVNVSDRLTSTFTLHVIQADPETVSAVDAMPPTLIQWDAYGGAKRNFRTMASRFVLFKYDYNGVLGVLHGTTA